MRFPAVNITSDKWDDLGDVESYILEEPAYYSNRNSILKKFYLDHSFCDSEGSIYLVKRLQPVKGISALLPFTKKGELVFEKTMKSMSLEDFKLFMLKKVNELQADTFTMKWIGIIHSAKSIEQILRVEERNST